MREREKWKRGGGMECEREREIERERERENITLIAESKVTIRESRKINYPSLIVYEECNVINLKFITFIIR